MKFGQILFAMPLDTREVRFKIFERHCLANLTDASFALRYFDQISFLNFRFITIGDCWGAGKIWRALFSGCLARLTVKFALQRPCGRQKPSQILLAHFYTGKPGIYGPAIALNFYNACFCRFCIEITLFFVF
ncbi:hypothetical protein CAMRE0001_3274 [Campylobacter rectus RM3267]|uniref:Uncharacterized protein n=2 Tax=Campylobacter rectus TaxID=203 RepID=A0A6G5QLW1_CAMRE|nr:hypothetical protein CAMRE0001_3274 [Campylobacter rectus RM3267]QCD46466.1 hypothetical protein CRECT_0787 [Campylobacter rectus]